MVIYSLEFVNVIITLAIIAFGIFLFIKEYFSIDTSSIIIMTLFIVTGILSPNEGLSGFINSAPVTIACMMVLSYSVLKSGILNGFTNTLVQVGKVSYVIALVVFCIITALFSSFINDSAVVAIMIPITLKVAYSTNISPSRLLLPISYAACLGGSITIIGTSANLVVSGFAESNNLPGFTMFSFSYPAIMLTAIGFVYLFFVMPLLLPSHSNQKTNNENDENGGIGGDELALLYISDIIIPSNSTEIGKSLRNSKIMKEYGDNLISINGVLLNESPESYNLFLNENDKIRLALNAKKLSELKGNQNYSIKYEKKLLVADSTSKNTKEESNLYEVIIPYGSQLAGKSLEEIKFRQTYNANVLGIRSHENNVIDQLKQYKLSEGNIMLIDTMKDSIREMQRDKLIVPLQSITTEKLNKQNAFLSITILAGVIIAAATNITSIIISAMVGSLLLVMLKVIKPDEAYKAIDWKIIFMIAGVLSMGTALEKSGTSTIIASHLSEALQSLDIRITLGLVYLVTLLATNILSGKAAAALMSPIVLQFALNMGVNYQPFLIAIMFACSYTFMTPICTPTNTMVYSAGNYTFNDYLKAGLPLNIILWLASVFIIPIFFPFK